MDAWLGKEFKKRKECFEMSISKCITPSLSIADATHSPPKTVKKPLDFG
tara:strand:+ start:1048 stop:1194 length:147 start_codon:yes stop_codon:yes gene_type:complete